MSTSPLFGGPMTPQLLLLVLAAPAHGTHDAKVEYVKFKLSNCCTLELYVSS